MLYAYAAIQSGVPYANFTPSVAADIPALLELARENGVPLAGKDGKTGQTMMKTVLAPALKARALHVDGWFSTNILGNRDGLALNDKDSLQSKLNTKGTVLDSILGYPVEDHLVHIHYYRPRGDDKEAWDNIDVTGFLGQRMQIKVNFLCKDSILASTPGDRDRSRARPRQEARRERPAGATLLVLQGRPWSPTATDPSTISASSSTCCSSGSAASNDHVRYGGRHGRPLRTA